MQLQRNEFSLFVCNIIFLLKNTTRKKKKRERKLQKQKEIKI